MELNSMKNTFCNLDIIDIKAQNNTLVIYNPDVFITCHTLSRNNY